MSSDCWKFDGLDFSEGELDAQIEPQEKAAIAAIHAIAQLAETQPGKALVIAASLRKLSTVAQSKAQAIGLRSITVRKVVKK